VYMWRDGVGVDACVHMCGWVINYVLCCSDKTL